MRVPLPRTAGLGESWSSKVRWGPEASLGVGVQPPWEKLSVTRASLHFKGSLDCGVGGWTPVRLQTRVEGPLPHPIPGSQAGSPPSKESHHNCCHPYGRFAPEWVPWAIRSYKWEQSL